PYMRIGREKETDIEEEKRLLYVGMTRAKTLLHLSYAHRRTWFGRPRHEPPSRFLAAIREELLRRARMRQCKKQQPAGRQLELF
ncbi:DNA helicase UvrD, partial [bacterium]|nr:DNA helicase UvrD [candidate division CSSED10-310 bacterium]